MEKKYCDSIFAEDVEQAEKILQDKKETEIILGCDPTKTYKD